METLELRFLGPPRVMRNGREVRLPQSKKTRALLAYLAVTRRPHLRDRLCNLLWDVADDPRGALRWSLSKLRRIVDDGDERRITADRETAAFQSDTAIVDVTVLATALHRGLHTLSTPELEVLAGRCRGEFLEGLELSDFMEFQAWCVAEREQARSTQTTVLQHLVERLADDPARAIPFARLCVQIDALSPALRIQFMTVLVRAGRRAEAQHQCDAGRKLLAELGASGVAEIEQAWQQLSSMEPPPERAFAPVVPESIDGGIVESAVPPRVEKTQAFVGRAHETQLLQNLVDDVRARRSGRIIVVSGEPGVGKSALAEIVAHTARDRGGIVLRGAAYEAESRRPYGPWGDAVRDLPSEILPGPELRSLVPESADGTGVDERARTRERFFAAVVDLLSACSVKRGLAVLILDDIQWLDRDSAELLHYALRMSLQRPLLVVLLARIGELADNTPVLKVLRSLRRDHGARDLQLRRLSLEETAILVRSSSPTLDDVAVQSIYKASSGNPLYALEVARSMSEQGGELQSSLVEIVRDRVERLPGDAPGVLRWSAVLGHAVDVELLEKLTSLASEQLVEALEALERHGLILVDPSGERTRYRFSHDVVRESVYGQLSEPRRRLMHRRVAELLADRPPSAEQASRLAHHASLAGDAKTAVSACISAGLHLLRMFANAEAESLAKRGLHLVSRLNEPQRTVFTLELLQVRYGAGTPMLTEETARELSTLAERALDYGKAEAARLGFHLLAYLRWERGDIAEAHDRMLDAERVSRSTSGAERASALAEAARCLLLVERNLGQAEAFTLEAESLARRGNEPNTSVLGAQGMLAAHRGESAVARQSFDEARRIARQHGNRLAEFQALEGRVMLEFDELDYREARRLAFEMLPIAERLREGSEHPSASALCALTRWACGETDAESSLRDAIEVLCVADAKFRVSYVLTRAAEIWLMRKQLTEAERFAQRGLDMADAISRATEQCLSHAVLLRCATLRADAERALAHREAIDQLSSSEMSSRARQALQQLFEEFPASPSPMAREEDNDDSGRRTDV